MNVSTPPATEELNNLFIAACNNQMEGKLEEAEKLYQKLLLWIDSPLLHYNLGLIYYEQQNYPDALDSFVRAVEGNPNDPDSLFNLALAYKACLQLDEAVTTYLSLLELEPDHLDALYNLAGCFREMRKDKKAIEYYLKVLDRDSSHASALNNIAYMYHLTEDFDNSLKSFRKLLELKPDHESAQHMIDSIEGRTPDSPPTSYVQEIFDNYSEEYEHSLVNKLHYSVPEKLREELNNVISSSRLFQNGIDLGCGTGLSGEAFTDLVKEFVGVDLSEKMIAVAREKQIYSSLYCGNVIDYLNTAPRLFDFAIAADVFNYIGNLNELFQIVSAKTQSSGIFCFSTERTESDQFVLRPTGRFAHSPAYLEELARNTGWQVILQKQTGLRKDKGEWIAGDLWIFEKK